jgi:arsenite methyltransferase
MSFISLDLDTPELARCYERLSSSIQFAAGQRLASMLAIRPGERVLDVGCGVGQLAEHVADLMGETGLVIGVDPLAQRIELARRRARPNLSFAIDNAYGLGGFELGSFDAVYLNVVFHWLPEKRAPLRRLHALLKPGGRLGLSAPVRGHIYRIQSIKAEILSRQPYDSHPEGLNGGAHPIDAGELHDLLVETGFSAPRIEIRRDVAHFAAPDEAIAFWEASSFGNVLGHLPEPLRVSARSEMAARLEELRTEEGIPHEAVRVFAVATKAG